MADLRWLRPRLHPPPRPQQHGQRPRAGADRDGGEEPADAVVTEVGNARPHGCHPRLLPQGPRDPATGAERLAGRLRGPAVAMGGKQPAQTASTAAAGLPRGVVDAPGGAGSGADVALGLWGVAEEQNAHNGGVAGADQPLVSARRLETNRRTLTYRGTAEGAFRTVREICRASTAPYLPLLVSEVSQP